MNHCGFSLKLFALFTLSCGWAAAHPMGNFSINHYARFTPGAKSVEVLYVLDIAELPSLQLLQDWKVTKDSPKAEIDAAARKQVQDWIRNLTFSVGGAPMAPHLERVETVIQDGAGGLPVVRVNSYLRLPLRAGALAYEDGNYAARAGWKEVVAPGVSDRSKALTAYPQDPTLAPPQDVQAHFELKAPAPVVRPMVTEAPLKAPAPRPVATAAAPIEAGSLGTVKRNDFLSRTLKGSKESLPFGLAVICLAAAFGFGALHAAEPGHGKTMVAAYLVGSRGTFRQAIFLGGMVTFTHTISVFVLGLVTLFLAQYILPETLMKVMGVISGVSIVWIGGLLLYRRGRKLMAKRGHTHSHHHHEHDHSHPHTHSHDHGHGHTHTHTHDGHTHSHVPEGEVTLGNLVALGVSGGLVPCPAALVLLLSCISIGRPGFGLFLLISFSLGLALVLMLIGVTVLLVKKTVPKGRQTAGSPAWSRYAPVASAALIFVIGIYMTGVSMGAFPVVRLLG